MRNLWFFFKFVQITFWDCADYFRAVHCDLFEVRDILVMLWTSIILLRKYIFPLMYLAKKLKHLGNFCFSNLFKKRIILLYITEVLFFFFLLIVFSMELASKCHVILRHTYIERFLSETRDFVYLYCHLVLWTQ